jgi:hypothetical protein
MAARKSKHQTGLRKPPAPLTERGSGAATLPPVMAGPVALHDSRDVTRLVTAAKRTDWGLPTAVHDGLPQALWDVVTKTVGEGEAARPRFKTRARIQAAKALIAMNGQNIATAPPEQTVNLHVTADVRAAITSLDGLPREQLEALAAAGQIIAAASQSASQVQQ